MNYEQQEHLSKADVAWIQKTFKDNNEAVDILRRLFIPSIKDPRLPIEELGKDLWLSIDLRAIPADEAKIVLLARQDAIKNIVGTLVQLKIIANAPEDNVEDIAAARAKNSTK